MNSKTLSIVAVFVIGASAMAYAFSSDDSGNTPVTPEVKTPVDTTTPEEPQELKGEAPKSTVRKAKPKKKEPFTLEEENMGHSADRLQLPNGKSVPILNGAYGAKNGWPSTIPYSPIIKVDIDANGERYYLHADGSQTKTVNVRNSVTGESVACTQVSNPVDPVMMDPEELEAVKKKQRDQKNEKKKRREAAKKKKAGQNKKK
jgi:glucan-binding YG repeat protein